MDKPLKQAKLKIIHWVIDHIDYMEKIIKEDFNFYCQSGQHEIIFGPFFLSYKNLKNGGREAAVELNLYEFWKLRSVFKNVERNFRNKQKLKDLNESFFEMINPKCQTEQ